ncbi:MAG: hypothetical protein J3K34DRAFT_117264 [Monoraphidium minutum]|nr:MAG: hypothetical protein J3K34DRAFT_117264 [Monoraphidium minutum]
MHGGHAAPLLCALPPFVTGPPHPVNRATAPGKASAPPPARARHCATPPPAPRRRAAAPRARALPNTPFKALPAATNLDVGPAPRLRRQWGAVPRAHRAPRAAAAVGLLTMRACLSRFARALRHHPLTTQGGASQPTSPPAAQPRPTPAPTPKPNRHCLVTGALLGLHGQARAGARPPSPAGAPAWPHLGRIDCTSCRGARLLPARPPQGCLPGRGPPRPPPPHRFPWGRAARAAPRALPIHV